VGIWANIFGKTEKRSIVNPYAAFFNGSAFGTTNVNRDSAASLAAWFRGTNIIAQAIAGLPKNLLKETPDGRKKITTHPALKLIKWNPTPNQDAYTWHEFMVGAIINFGNGYSLIERDERMRPIGLILVHPDRVEVVVQNSVVHYKVKTSDNDTMVVSYDDMYHVKGQTLDGYVGLSTIEYHRVTLGTSLSAQNFSQDFYDNNTNLEGYLKYDGDIL